MRDLKNKEVIAGLIILILLSITAMILIVRKELNSDIVLPSQTDIEKNNEIDKEETKVIEDNSSISTVTEMENNTTESITKDSDSISEKYVSATLKEYTTDDWQLKELFYYWDEYQLDAVEDLIRLERVRVITNELAGTNNYYYYGEKDGSGKPNGNGLAVYANNAYYCGEWKNGLRSGEGMWLQIFPDETATINKVKGVKEHLYNGMFENDYPNGSGQEHFEYDIDLLNTDDAIANAIGTFKDGYYDGDMYIMTISTLNSTTDWNAKAKKGVFIPLEDKKSTTGQEPVWEKSEGDEEDIYYWMLPSTNHEFGICGLKK